MMGEQDVRERLKAVEVPATQLRVGAVVEGGRRRARRRRAAQAGLGAALATGLLAAVPSLMAYTNGQRAGQPAGLPSTAVCPATWLPVPDGMTAVRAAGVDPGGRYVIANDFRSSKRSTPQGKLAGVGHSQPVLWTDGMSQTLPKVGDWVQADAVSAGGVVAAVAGPKDKWADSVLRYIGGVPEKMIPPAGKWTFRDASVNRQGDIIVNATRQGSGDRTDAVLLWKANAATATKLPLPAYAEGTSILDDGSILGSVVSAKGDLTSFRWDERGLGRALTGPANQQGAVNDAHGDWATGNLWPSGEVARWDLRTGEVTVLPVNAPANAVNAAGWIVSNGTVLRDDATVELSSENGGKGEPFAIADTGLVVGWPFDDRSGVITWQCDR
ncbi:hypothetical protein ACPCHT_38535 [Nucisporomicrobium flavum]|uniref:hypothetical protein n=1 Tax=Nucisporomicrobium flavum TaxID=2785915 RepID=UPI003C2B79B8